jgi:F-type H+-transporting ATPase subunit b
MSKPKFLRLSRSIRLLAPLAGFAFALLMPSLGFSNEHEGGEHGGGHSIDGKTLALQLFNFGVLLFIMIKFGGGAINKALRGRHDKMKLDLDEAQRMRAEAEARLKEQEARLSNLQKDLADLRQSMKDSADAEKKRLIELSEARALRIAEETSFLLDQQVKQAELSFKAEVANAAARIAEEIVRRSVNTSDQQRLVSTFVSDVATQGSSERTA